MLLFLDNYIQTWKTIFEHISPKFSLYIYIKNSVLARNRTITCSRPLFEQWIDFTVLRYFTTTKLRLLKKKNLLFAYYFYDLFFFPARNVSYFLLLHPHFIFKWFYTATYKLKHTISVSSFLQSSLGEGYFARKVLVGMMIITPKAIADAEMMHEIERTLFYLYIY